MGAERRIALLIDADNVSHSQIAFIVEKISGLGTATIRRAYGDWSSDHLGSWKSKLHEFAIRPMQQFSYTQGKNATDIALVIDAMELLYTQDIDGFCIASSDSDFTPLVMKLKDNGCAVYGFGETKTPKPFSKSCTSFFVLGDCAKAAPAAPPATVKTQPAKVPVAAKPAPKNAVPEMLVVKPADELALYDAVARTVAESGWALLTAACSYASQNSGIKPKGYKRANFSSVFKATRLFVVAKGTDGQMYITDARNKSRAAAPTIN